MIILTKTPELVSKFQKNYLYLRKQMRVISKRAIVEFYSRHADSKVALEDWYEKVRKFEWDSFSDLKNTFGSADNVGNKRVVFNIKGNDYRLVAIVQFTIKRVYVRFVGTHREYERLTEEQIKNI